MKSPIFADRTWAVRDVMILTLLLFLAGVGMVFRSACGFAETRLGISGPALAVAFLTYCVAVALLTRWIFMSGQVSSARKVLAILTIAIAAIFVSGTTLLIPTSVDQHADRDDALDIASRQLWQGLDPWSVPTQLGPEQHPSPLLGGILLALPFVIVLGSSAIQSIFWFALGAWLAVRDFGLMRGAAFAFLLVSSPIFVNEIVFQSDLWVNALVIAIATLWGYRALTAAERARWSAWLSGGLLALAMADRFIFWPLMIPIAGLLIHARNSRRTLAWLAGVPMAAAALTAIPWLIFPESLDQTLRNVSKASSDVIPHSGLLLVGVMITISVIGTFWSRSLRGTFITMSLTMLAVPSWQALQSSLESGTLAFNGYTVVAYSAAFLIFGILAFLVPRPTSESEQYSATTQLSQ